VALGKKKMASSRLESKWVVSQLEIFETALLHVIHILKVVKKILRSWYVA